MWNERYAAHRYFRRRGDTVMGENKMVIHNSPPRNGTANARHTATLKKLHYDFANSLFIKTEIKTEKPCIK